MHRPLPEMVRGLFFASDVVTWKLYNQGVQYFLTFDCLY